MALDLNSDLGEGFGPWTMGDDEAMLDIVTSANIACGFHAGDPSIMRRSCQRAVDRGVRIGAQVGYRDLAGFGRRRIDIAPDELRDEVLYQVGSLDAFARAAGDRVRYVKPHGALYHVAAAEDELAEAVAGAVVDFDAEVALLGPANTRLEAAARVAGLRFVAEGFADRGYLPNGLLAPRGSAGAVLGLEDAVAQAMSIALSGSASAVDNSGEVTVNASSICVHGDTPAAVQMARRVCGALDEVGVVIEPFV